MPDEFSKKVGKNITNLLLDRGKTQADMARELKISKATISSWCSGTRVPRMDKVDEMCKYFMCSRSDIIGDVDVTGRKKKKNIITIHRASEKSVFSFRNQLRYVYGDNTVEMIDAYVAADDITKELVRRALGIGPLKEDVRNTPLDLFTGTGDLQAAHKRTDVDATAADLKHDEDIMGDEDF